MSNTINSVADLMAMESAEMPKKNNTKVPVPKQTETVKKVPAATEVQKVIPPAKELDKTVPEASPLDKEMPKDIKVENYVTLKGQAIEIKPTKLKYFRNHTANIYSVLKAVPLSDFLSYSKGTFDRERDSDQMLFDFLVAVFDDVKLVKANYDDMTADDIESILKIFGRLNHIDEKEEQARKNKEAQVKR